MKIIQVGAELFHADRQTEAQAHLTKVIFVFRNFVKAQVDTVQSVVEYIYINN